MMSQPPRMTPTQSRQAQQGRHWMMTLDKVSYPRGLCQTPHRAAHPPQRAPHPRRAHPLQQAPPHPRRAHHPPQLILV